ncbi:hypothetical protein ETB97_011406 [Aspergillus alliaceus]|uniref:Uncharacterized protein n=1 Tax=Petromyces alliaceus TaxID=209559 RepID=A0A8H6EBI9_PETAA|nr:hypothetical protein ETB97_011406 [Aspergillus burnettii]
MAKTAFITGANGIGGSAIDSIIVTSGGPFNPTVTDPRIKFIALDFTHDTPSLVEKMKEVCGPVSHAYFCSYLDKDDFAESPQLENVTLQSGGKHYNLQVEPVPSPAREDDPLR